MMRARERAMSVIMMDVIGRVAVRRDKTSRVVVSPDHPLDGVLNASQHGDDESKAHVDDPPLLVELVSHILQLNLDTSQLPSHVVHLKPDRIELGLNITHLGEEGIRDTLHARHDDVMGTLRQLSYIYYHIKSNAN
jgi:hypothetical protein